jgi:hypothetical protein
MSKEIREMIDKVKNFNKSVNENVNKYNYDLSDDHIDNINRKNAVEINSKRDENKYSSEEYEQINYIRQRLESIGLINGIDYNLDVPQNSYRTKTERFGFLFWIKKLDKKFGHHDVDSLLKNTNLIVTNPFVGGQAHGFIQRTINIK